MGKLSYDYRAVNENKRKKMWNLINKGQVHHNFFLALSVCRRKGFVEVFVIKVKFP